MIGITPNASELVLAFREEVFSMLRNNEKIKSYSQQAILSYYVVVVSWNNYGYSAILRLVLTENISVEKRKLFFRYA